MRLLQFVFLVSLFLTGAVRLSAQGGQGSQSPPGSTTARPGQTGETSQQPSELPRQPSEPQRPSSGSSLPTNDPLRPIADPLRPTAEPTRPATESPRPLEVIGRPAEQPTAPAQAGQRSCGSASTPSSGQSGSSPTAVSSAFPGVSASQLPRAGVSADAFERPGVSTAQLAALLPGARPTPCAPPRDVILYPDTGAPSRRVPPPGEND